MRHQDDEVGQITQKQKDRFRRKASAVSSSQYEYGSVNNFGVASTGNQRPGTMMSQVLSQSGKPDLMLTNVMKLENILRATSREENPEPKYNLLLRTENKVERIERMKKEAKEVPLSVAACRRARRTKTAEKSKSREVIEKYPRVSRDFIKKMEQMEEKQML